MRQGNMNPKVNIFRYVTESTFDAYSWQLIETKQKFSSQIFTSKSPVRSCEDVDATALTYAELKALSTGNPAIKEKMDLDIQVAKLKLLKANHTSNRYRLEDSIAKIYPMQIAQLKSDIAAYSADIMQYQAHKITDPEQFVMEVGGKVYMDKKEAGTALLAACKAMKQADVVLDAGNYQGFHMRIKFNSFFKEFTLSLKHESVNEVKLGSDVTGNIIRINNLLDGLPARLEHAQQKLCVVEQQLQDAKEEVEKPFPKEAELDAMLERLSELNAELNMDGKGADIQADDNFEAIETAAKGKQTIHDRLEQAKAKLVTQHTEKEQIRNDEICV